MDYFLCPVWKFASSGSSLLILFAIFTLWSWWVIWFLPCFYKGLHPERRHPGSQIAESCRIHHHIPSYAYASPDSAKKHATWLAEVLEDRKKHHRKTNNPLTHTLQRLWIFSPRDLKAWRACSPHRTLLSLSSLASIISSFEAHAELKGCFVCKKAIINNIFVCEKRVLLSWTSN